MTTNAQTEEVPFLSAMEREPKESPTAINWRLDALQAKVDQLTLPMKETAQAAMAGLKAAMANLGDRGPSMDAPFAEVNARLSDIERALDRRIGDYHEAPRAPREDKGPSWKERVLTICGTLVVIGVPALVIMYGQLSALKSTQDAQQVLLTHQQSQIDQLIQLQMNRK